MNKEQIMYAIAHSYKNTSQGFLIDHNILADKILALSQPTADLDELKERWIKYCTDNKMNGVIKGWNFFLPHLQKPVDSEWIKLKDKKPEREPNVKYSNVPCLVIYRGQVCILCFNHEHECWDDEDGDDYCCDIESIEFWQPLPKPPIK